MFCLLGHLSDLFFWKRPNRNQPESPDGNPLFSCLSGSHRRCSGNTSIGDQDDLSTFVVSFHKDDLLFMLEDLIAQFPDNIVQCRDVNEVSLPIFVMA